MQCFACSWSSIQPCIRYVTPFFWFAVGLTELHVLDLSDNQLTGSSLPPGLARAALHTLRLANNQLQGKAWQQAVWKALPWNCVRCCGVDETQPAAALLQPSWAVAWCLSTSTCAR
jgi:hypothetical protein